LHFVEGFGDKSKLIATFSKGFPYLIDNETFRQERNDSHRAMVCSMTVQEESPRIASCDVESNINVWDCHSNLVYTKIKAPIKGGALKMSFSQNERHLAGSSWKTATTT
jgi:hypothetical protein